MISQSELHLHSTTATNEHPITIEMDAPSAGWDYTGLAVVSLTAGSTWSGAGGDTEVALVPLGGRCTVQAGDMAWTLGERASVFAGKPWALYLSQGADFIVTAETQLELAICTAVADRVFPPRLIAPEDVQVEIRGAGNAARQINHVIPPDFPAHRLLVVEVITPSGNWSSYPPHKHDVSQMPAEADLEEIYYYRIDPPEGFGLQRLYTADGSRDEAFVIKDGDLLLVPDGYHAFCVGQGYTGYYLNVLAGNEPVRTMQPIDDPAHHWLRATWNDDQNGGASSWREIDSWVNRGAGRRTG